MKILKEGEVVIKGNDVFIQGWKVEGGTSAELYDYVMSRSRRTFIDLCLLSLLNKF